ncbi:YraN family protein [Paenibacillus sp. OV219]|uniref:YraN family protein n=1 Tax=Paenibacillus sp. OV219 TaxID=1884377 RepID=UPI0008BD8A24|nr:YraN family protein [Paenibacillus sp. OV219]SEN31067.1 putative endonuclease [Paenibacillus sp. OV219]
MTSRRQSNEEKKADSRQTIGKFGEEQAARYLDEQGYYVLARNWRCRSGELDIIAQTADTFVIIEVRTRRQGGRFGTAAESVDFRKQYQVRATAEVYISLQKLHGQPVRFDVIAITAVPTPSEPIPYQITELKHIKAAF